MRGRNPPPRNSPWNPPPRNPPPWNPPLWNPRPRPCAWTAVLDIIATPNSNDAARTNPPNLRSKFFPFMISLLLKSCLPTPDVETRTPYNLDAIHMDVRGHTLVCDRCGMC